MAINRALMNRQMYNMGGSSLETGAPDITLTGDMRPTYSAMRKQRLAGGGIASMRDRIKYDVKPGETLVGKPGGLVEPGVKQYGLLSKIKDKIVDDLIPNEIKENPMITALGGAALVNQFGLPDAVTNYLNMGSDVGQNFVGELLNFLPGDTQFNTVLGDNIPFSYQDITSNRLPGGLDQFIIGGGIGGGNNLSMQDYMTDFGQNIMSQVIPDSVKPFIGMNTGINPANMSTNQANQLAIEQYKRRNLQQDLIKALAAGSAAGAYVESQPKDTLPTDTTGVNFQTAQQAMNDPNLRFKPPLEATQLAANGGRIGYDMGGGVMMASNIENDKILEALLEKYLDMGLSLPDAEEAAQKEFERMSMRPSNRVMAQEGGLMDLGGMEKDYREEGGFVPIGGKEKADDVPARLSKNEFVFTADAVRNAGGGDIDEGAAIMERLMDNLEQGGKVSEESQGLAGAREMFETSQRLEKRII
jgi:hypothetical protein